MTVFTTGGYLAGKHVFPVNYSGEQVSQRLVDAAHVNDLDLAMELLADPFVDVNFVGTVCLKSRRTELVLHGETATEVRVEFEEFKTEVTPLFLAAHNGNATLVRKLLVSNHVYRVLLFQQCMSFLFRSGLIRNMKDCYTYVVILTEGWRHSEL